ncbi:PstS family phosphate ABC transporter substrate-binding protein [Collimonas humicola]|uniref:PstS family phosphate ABC transporter substrate-binding protein n=1 Tax=Collimonas humicola TaxID=2825886 RepID=UPI001B8CDF5E|nr:substrate-binding domain-containing protein [Collimonas humicola]
MSAPEPDKLSAAAASNQPQRDAVRLTLAGAEGTSDLFTQINAMFAGTQPAVRIDMALKGSVTGLPALTAGAASIVVVTHEASAAEIAAFRQVWGYAPFLLRIGYAGYGQNAPAVYVNRRNPLPGLSMQQLARVFTAGAAAGNINFWSQLGLKDSWQQRRIHLYGLRDDGGSATVLRTGHLGKHSYASHYEALDSRQAVLAAVADDPYGIALLAPGDTAALPELLRILPLSAADGTAAVTPSRDNVASGKYPPAVYVQLYLNRPPAQPLDEQYRNYLKLILSPAGQNLMAGAAGSKTGYLPLSADDLKKEIKKLD